jgi:predicted CXXCH cytochrome family protein
LNRLSPDKKLTENGSNTWNMHGWLIDRFFKNYLFAVMILLFSAAAFFTTPGCSPVRHHKTLSFFFDGVPDSAEINAAKSHDTISRPSKFIGVNKIPTRDAIAKAFMHPPYQERKCNKCHEEGGMGKARSMQPAPCFQCHEDFSSKYTLLHGPAGSGNCTQCHNPHMADNNKLLIRKGRDLCLYCHESGLVYSTTLHAGVDDKPCTECHNPHGGKDRRFLR